MWSVVLWWGYVVTTCHMWHVHIHIHVTWQIQVFSNPITEVYMYLCLLCGRFFVWEACVVWLFIFCSVTKFVQCIQMWWVHVVEAVIVYSEVHMHVTESHGKCNNHCMAVDQLISRNDCIIILVSCISAFALPLVNSLWFKDTILCNLKLLQTNKGAAIELLWTP